MAQDSKFAKEMVEGILKLGLVQAENGASVSEVMTLLSETSTVLRDTYASLAGEEARDTISAGSTSQPSKEVATSLAASVSEPKQMKAPEADEATTSADPVQDEVEATTAVVDSTKQPQASKATSKRKPKASDSTEDALSVADSPKGKKTRKEAEAEKRKVAHQQALEKFPDIPRDPHEDSLVEDHELLACKVCGKTFKSIKRHLRSAHKMNEADYIAFYNLPKGYHFSSHAYREKRAELIRERNAAAAKTTEAVSINTPIAIETPDPNDGPEERIIASAL